MPLSMKAKLKEVNAPLPENAKNGEPLKKNKKAVLIRLSGYFFRYKFRVLAAFLLIIGSNLARPVSLRQSYRRHILKRRSGF